MKKYVVLFALFIAGGFVSTALAATEEQTPSTTSWYTTEATVRDYFADIPVMIEIARCESKFRQYADSGNVFRGGVGQQMVGVFQFFDRYHERAASALGFDIETLDGNLAYARHVYTLEGTAPWISAQDCWDTPEIMTTTSDMESDEVLLQKIDLLKQIISLLQTLLAMKQINS